MPLLEGSETQLPPGRQVHLTVLHTSDIHSRLIPYDFTPLRTDQDLGLIPEMGPFGGATRLAALVKRERAKSDRVIHLDSGDSFQGAPIFNVNTGEVEYKLLSRMGLDGVVVGNHEFDAGLANFVERARDLASFPVLAANYIWDDYYNPDNLQAAKYTQPYTIRTVRGLRVGVIGMANISTLNSIVEGGNSLQTTPYEQNEAARAYVELLRPVVDVIAITSHLGLHEDQWLIQGYDAYYEYGRAKEFVERESNPWKIVEWFGPEGEPSSVVRVRIPGVSGIDILVGGHLHVVLNPPQSLSDPSGRKVLLVHSGAFAKYLGRLDVVVKLPEERGAPEGAEVVSHTYRVFPLDALWCSDALHDYYKTQFWGPGQFRRDPKVLAGIEACSQQEDRETTDLLQPYIIGMDINLNLASIFSYAPADIARRNNSTGGDSPLGNIAADAMRKRRTVEAEVALTNSLGIRDNLYAGPLTQEAMFNVFPFENTINLMFLSGVEMQELFDFVADRSATRGCVSQAQISGAQFTMDCAQVQLNDQRIGCDPTRKGVENGKDCPADGREGRAPWQCIEDVSGAGRCWSHSAVDIKINGKPIDPYGTYRIAVNDYIAKGGSGFAVLKRNTTRVETGIALRDSLIGYMQGFCNCDDINAGRETSSTGARCGQLVAGKWVVDDGLKSFCAS
ncbi:MAG TPA: bifunctional UDP-sugar hydrolase/5'-nucleotidase, partial [Myxococcaceae bacterium]|nr:bifunctional UDP-sugar hydrolase/5'-nucleotidase [Myxococcaceae bacterium]